MNTRAPALLSPKVRPDKALTESELRYYLNNPSLALSPSPNPNLNFTTNPRALDLSVSLPDLPVNVSPSASFCLSVCLSVCLSELVCHMSTW